jgi:hypothetical protein
LKKVKASPVHSNTLRPVTGHGIWLPLAAAAVVATLTGACQGAQVRTAPYRVRPDSVKPGSLLGPFDGQVKDAVSGDPVTGALVYATWTFQSGYGLRAPSGYRESVTSTDANGRYRVPRLGELPKGSHLTDFYLVVYKRGYVAYRSDRRFDDLGSRLDFAQRQNEISLDRWRSDYSHVRHMRYVGGGPAIAALTAWESDEAAAELSGLKEGPRVASDFVVSGGTMTASQLVNEQDIRTLTGFDGSFETGPLNDEPDTDDYSSQHFRALGQPESFDVAVRLWKTDSAAAEVRYKELVDSLPRAKETDEIADRSLRATEQEIYGVAFLDRQRGVLVLLTCGQGQCKSTDQLVALGRKAHERVRQRVPVDAGAPLEPVPEPLAPGSGSDQGGPPR